MIPGCPVCGNQDPAKIEPETREDIPLGETKSIGKFLTGRDHCLNCRVFFPHEGQRIEPGTIFAPASAIAAHASDCAMHNAPADRAAPCDCGVVVEPRTDAGPIIAGAISMDEHSAAAFMAMKLDVSNPLPPGEYAIAEILGHRTIVGRFTEVDRFGVKMLAIEAVWESKLLPPHFVGGASLYAFTPCSRDVALKRQAKQRYNLPEPIAAMLPPDADRMAEFGRGGIDTPDEEDMPF